MYFEKLQNEIPDLFCLHTQKFVESVACARNAVPVESE